MENLTFRVLDPPTALDGHSHVHAHILLPLTENLYVAYNGVQYYINSQELCFIPPHSFHHCYCLAEVITMDIPPHMIRQSDLITLESRIVYPIEGNLAPLTQLIKSEIQQHPNSSSICYLFYFLYEKLVENNECISLRYIREHFNEPFSIQTLAQLENYNPSYYTDWFRKKIGCSPSKYLREFRVERAKEMLLNPRFSLLDIAVQIGYNSHSAFTRAFKQTVGCSPQEYRNHVLANVL